ncbi:NADH-quinone oxidoreductase subunit J [Thalassotalea sediminis]|uniref:NADH-quinone oxidoreductase subunit J n=1 Tax=Thalassotalea sediminis TaxID=1759089 RepID=UPI0025727DF8|nr:NADH-quinone oxidoreductase subunit J [Thalassotalea sediminis]
MSFSPLITMFYLAALIAVIASIKVVTRKNTVHALLYLVVSLIAVAVCFYLMGAPFAAGLEVIVYAGAILVLFVFAIMLFGLREDETHYAPQNRGFSGWIGPVCLSVILLIELVYTINHQGIQQQLLATVVDAKRVGILLYGPYLLAVEIASFLLLTGLVAAYHFAKTTNHGGPA